MPVPAVTFPAACIAATLLTACASAPERWIERFGPEIDRLVPRDAKIEVLAGGFEWSEGPVWVRDGGYVLFSDIPQNAVYRWKEGEGTSVYLQPAGYTGAKRRAGELGSNGLTLDADGRLVLCQHGDRRIARMDAALDAPRSAFETLAASYGGARFNSPNDLVYRSNGDLYFTDPPYGLEQQVDDPGRELDFQGVYRLATDGTVTLLTKAMTRPNGIGFSPDERTLYVAQSDPAAARWMAFPVEADGTLGKGRVLLDVTDSVIVRPGLPDGLAVDVDGNLFATRPGGVYVISPEGKHLGTIVTGEATANCAFGDDGRTLYITADTYLMRVRLTTTGLGFAKGG
jgi:gluconolactonase